ncbi:MAG: TolC family protein [Bacteroidales bacterium]|nr:TolC family protein [Bacteroidales bacterium]
MRKLLLLILIWTCFQELFAQSDTLYLSVSDCRDIALDKNHSIRSANAQLNMAQSYRKSVKTQYFGQFNFVGNYQLTNKPFQVLNDNIFMPVVPFWAIDQENMDLSPEMLENPLINGIVSNPLTGEVLTDPDGNPLFFFYSYLPADQMQFGTHHNFVFGTNFSQPLYLGGKIRNLNRIAQSGMEIAACNLEIEKTHKLYEVEEAYWRIVDLQEKQNLTTKYIQLLRQILYDVNNLFDEGIVTRAEVLQVELKLNEAELNLAKIKNGLILSEMALCQIMGLPVDTKIHLIDSPDNIKALPSPEGITESAISGRNEIKILNETQTIALAQKNILKSRFLPNASLTANYLFMNPNPYKGFSNTFGSDWTIGLSVHIPITHWGDRFHTMNASNELASIAEIKKEEAVSLISLEVKQVWFNYSESINNLKLMEKSVELSDETLRIAQDSFNEGMISVAALLEAQTNWHKSKANLIEAKTQIKLLEVEYKNKTAQF